MKSSFFSIGHFSFVIDFTGARSSQWEMKNDEWKMKTRTLIYDNGHRRQSPTLLAGRAFRLPMDESRSRGPLSRLFAVCAGADTEKVRSGKNDPRPGKQ